MINSRPLNTSNLNSKSSSNVCIEYYVTHPSFSLSKANPEDAGYDLRSRESHTLASMDRVLVKTGIFLKIPEGWEVQIRPRSGLALKHGITIPNSPGTIDCGYVQEVGVILQNLGKEDFVISPGDRIAQMVPVKLSQCELSNSLKEPPQPYTSRQGGFGSSGK